MRKHGIRQIMRVICFLLMLIVLIVSFSYMLAPKDNTAEGGTTNPNANGFFSEPKDSIDSRNRQFRRVQRIFSDGALE